MSERTAKTFKYDAFLSYQTSDAKLASLLQKTLESFPVPGSRRQSLRVFRFETDTVMTDDLWLPITRNMADSRSFVLLVSSAAARSKWVGKEIEHWTTTRGRQDLLLVSADGELPWAGDDFVFDDTHRLPEALRGFFTHQPKYLDLAWVRQDQSLAANNLQFHDALADLAAALLGVDKRLVLTEHLARQRRRVRNRGLIIAGLSLLTLLSLILAFGLRRQTVATERALDEATRQRDAKAVALKQTERERDAKNEALKEATRQRLQAETNLAAAKAARDAEQRQTVLAMERQHQAEVAQADAVQKKNEVLAVHATLFNRGLAAESTLRLREDPSLALLLAAESFRRDKSNEAKTTLFGHLYPLRHVATMLHSPHPGDVSSVQVDREGRSVVGIVNGLLHVWDVATGRLTNLPEWSLRKRNTWAAAIASGSGDIVTHGVEPAVLWSKAGFPKEMIPTSTLFRAALSPDANKLVGLACDGKSEEFLERCRTRSILIWKRDSRGKWSKEAPLETYTFDARRQFAVTQDASVVAWTSSDRLEVWSTTQRARMRSLLLPLTDNLSSLECSVGCNVVAAGDETGIVSVWKGEDKRRTLNGHTAPVGELAFSREGHLLASGDAKGNIVVWNWDTGARLAIFDAHVGDITALSFGAGASVLVSGDSQGNTAVWDLRGERFLSSHSPGTGEVTAYARTASGIVAGDRTGRISLFDLSGGGRLIGLAGGPSLPVDGLAMNPEGTALAAFYCTRRGKEQVCGEGTVAVWSHPWTQPPQVFQRQPPGDSALAVSPDSQLVVLAGFDGRVFIVNRSTGALVNLPRFPSESGAQPPTELVFSRLGRDLVAGYYDGSVARHDIATLRAQSLPQLHGLPITALAINDAGVVASADANGLLYLTNPGDERGSLDRPLQAHAGAVTALSFDGTGELLLTGGMDRVVRGWDVAARAATFLRIPVSGAPLAMTFSPDGNVLGLLAGDDDAGRGRALKRRFFTAELSPESLMAHACRIANRNLSILEWRRFLAERPYEVSCPQREPHPSLIAEAGDLAKAGRVQDGIQVLERLESQLTSRAVGGVAWNNLCWQAALQRQASLGLVACERALKQASGDDRAQVHDSRGVNRALLGDLAGAIADFETFIAALKTNPLLTDAVSKREAWVAALRQGRNPFDEATLAALKTE
jgi:WD40 repeat protein